jgi:hypothetical protein
MDPDFCQSDAAVRTLNASSRWPTPNLIDIKARYLDYTELLAHPGKGD